MWLAIIAMEFIVFIFICSYAICSNCREPRNESGYYDRNYLVQNINQEQTDAIVNRVLLENNDQVTAMTRYDLVINSVIVKVRPQILLYLSLNQ